MGTTIQNSSLSRRKKKWRRKTASSSSKVDFLRSILLLVFLFQLSSVNGESGWRNPQQPPPPPPPPPGRPSNSNDNSHWNDDVDPPMTTSADTHRRYDDPANTFDYNGDNRKEEAYRNDPSLSTGADQEEPSSYGYYGSPPPSSTSSTTSASSTTTKMPIHYEFKSKSSSDEKGDDWNEAKKETQRDNDGDTSQASARQDLITRHMSTTSGKLQVYSSSTIVGASIGAVLAKILLPVSTTSSASVVGVVFAIGSLLRTAFGELVRALGLSIVLVLQRSSKVRRTYPTWRYVGACVGLRDRGRPFPPSRNPWKYQPRYKDDVDFRMIYSIVAMAMVGAMCGGTIRLPLFPTWIGALGLSAFFAMCCTFSSPRGDLFRTLGMRVVALIEELWGIQAELRIIPKLAVVSSQVLDKAMVFDRKHKVKDRFLSVVNKGYDQAMSAASTLQQQREEGNSDRERRRDDERRDDRGPSRRGGRPRDDRRPARGRDGANDDDRGRFDSGDDRWRDNSNNERRYDGESNNRPQRDEDSSGEDRKVDEAKEEDTGGGKRRGFFRRK